ncbi:(Fe-S)-binding protein [Dyella telluris]|uniref:Glycolate oxidase iron-sulfur subunit n=2 Tax=Dyella telluris TaxID=2763498 RepID=A0A7G8PZK0_9GAMM|nr:(Fe-S)-binding protein [Dyella telluris]QNJ99957.1 (Fe-S)-binding protein [Dyella telluris]
MITMALEKPPHTRKQKIVALADQCVQCGLCLPTCPTYGLDGNEAESPRGRIAIAAALARGDAEPTAALRIHLDHCLGCLNCQRVCPANVKYGELLVETRALIGPAPERPTVLLTLLRQPTLLRLAARVAGTTGVAYWKQRLASRLPANSAWRAALQTWSDADSDAKPLPAPADDAGHTTVAIFPGCVASVEDEAAERAAITLLQAAGYRVARLPAFCCGAMDLHGGDMDTAVRLADRVRENWHRSGATKLVTVTPGCLGTLRRALPDVAVSDPVSLLAERIDRLAFRPLEQRIALHFPCTQLNVARSEAALQELLRKIPSLDIAVVPRPPHCCGAAGTHMLEFPERAARLREGVLGQIATLAPEQLLSSNIGCRLHLAAGMDEQGRHWPHMHPLTLLAQQLEISP